MICTFFGHRDSPQDIKSDLESILIDLIENKNVNLFYIGNNGNFDRMAKTVLKKLKNSYPHILYYVVLAYFPFSNVHLDEDLDDTIYPDGFEEVLPKYAIVKRNIWMINNADVVVTYVKHGAGGAFKFKSIAEKNNKIVINIGEKLKE